jgi:glutaredoxin
LIHVKIITADWCTAPEHWYCESAKKLLSDSGINYTELDLDDSHSILEFWELTGVPQIFVNGKLLEGGYTALRENIDTLKKGNTDD